MQRELDWLLEDAVRCVERRDGRGAATFGPWTAHSVGGGDALLSAPLDALAELWRRRLEDREPLAYLIGAVHWRDVVLAVAPGVLVPRPETSDLVDLALREAGSGPEGDWADLGTGSGAIGLALARELPGHGTVWLVDRDPTAVAVASTNARRLGVPSSGEGRGSACVPSPGEGGGSAGAPSRAVRVLQGSWSDSLPIPAGSLAGVASNPPYVLEGAISQAEVLRHEPAGALFGGGADGADSLRDVSAAAARLLMPGGALVLETGGAAQASLVASWLVGGDAPARFAHAEIERDAFGVERFVVARRAI